MRGGSVFDLAIIFQKVACQNKLPLVNAGEIRITTATTVAQYPVCASVCCVGISLSLILRLATSAAAARPLRDIHRTTTTRPHKTRIWQSRRAVHTYVTVDLRHRDIYDVVRYLRQSGALLVFGQCLPATTLLFYSKGKGNGLKKVSGPNGHVS